jgi:hypothetical protein
MIEKLQYILQLSVNVVFVFITLYFTVNIIASLIARRTSKVILIEVDKRPVFRFHWGDRIKFVAFGFISIIVYETSLYVHMKFSKKMTEEYERIDDKNEK